VTEKTEFGHYAKLEETNLTPQVAGTQEHGLSDMSSQEQVFVACDQPVASSAPPTPDSARPFLSAYATNIAPECSPGMAVFEAYQPPLQQIAPRSFQVAMNGDKAIGGALRETQQARKEYKQGLDAGKMVYLLEQAAPDGKCLKDMAKVTRKLTIS